MDLSSFSARPKVCLIGSSGGIGNAFNDHFKKADQSIDLYCFSRIDMRFDLRDEDSIKSAADSVPDQDIDIILITTGYLGTSPEKSLKSLSAEKFQKLFAVNTIGPALVMKHFAPKLVKDRKSVMAALSARVGSIEDNRLGGWYSYRASKAALNMIIRNAAIEIGRTNKHAAIIGLHPGTVDTNLSKPFQDHVPEGKLFTPEYATKQMLKVINMITADDTGHIFAYDGQKIDW